jgi:hypothetical protein
MLDEAALLTVVHGGVLVARIMSDVEGVRNVVGTGVVEFLGGMLTALLAFG